MGSCWWNRKHPLEAYEWTGEFNSVPPEWRATGALSKGRNNALIIQTAEFRVTAEVGDFVARDAVGGFYRIKRGVFLETYEPETT